MKNMGMMDRVVRLAIVAIIAAAYAFGYLDGAVATALGVVAVAFLLTGLVGTCPIYMPFGFSTRRDR